MEKHATRRSPIRIKSFSSTFDWFAVLEVNGKPEPNLLVGWAVRQERDTDDEEIVGIIPFADAPSTDVAEDLDNFCFYIHRSELNELDLRFGQSIGRKSK